MKLQTLNKSPTIHGTAVLIGAKAVVIRGVSGSGKSLLAYQLIQQSDTLRRIKLVGDDRIHLTRVEDAIIVSPATNLAGSMELRGSGIIKLSYEPFALVGLLVDLTEELERLPDPRQDSETIEQISLPRLKLLRPSGQSYSIAAEQICGAAKQLWG